MPTISDVARAAGVSVPEGLAAGVVLADLDADAGAEGRVAMAILLVAAAPPEVGASLAGGHYCPSKPIVAPEGFALTPDRSGLA